MARFYWDITSSTTFPIDTGEVFDFSNEGQVITRAKVSKEVLKAILPELFWRQYVAKEVDFSARTGNHTLKVKNISNARNNRWQETGEFEPYSSAQAQFKMMSVEVNEKGRAFYWTERAELMSAVDIVEQTTAFAKDVMIESLNTDIARAFLYLDILAIARAGTNVGTNKIIVGKTLLTSKTFSAQSNPISITQATMDTTLGTIEGETVGTLTMNNILNLAVHLANNRMVLSRNGSGYGNYTVILNRQAYARLMQDPTYREVVMRNNPERIYSGYIGNFYGQDFVVDTSGAIDYILTNPDFVGNDAKANFLSGKAIAILISKNPVIEAVLLPEQLTQTETKEFGRYKAFAVKTYRGESPTWFASADGVGSGAVLIGL